MPFFPDTTLRREGYLLASPLKGRNVLMTFFHSIIRHGDWIFPFSQASGYFNSVISYIVRIFAIIKYYYITACCNCSLFGKKNKHPDFHQMLVCQKYGGVAEIRTRASLATPNDLANRPLQPAWVPLRFIAAKATHLAIIAYFLWIDKLFFSIFLKIMSEPAPE